MKLVRPALIDDSVLTYSSVAESEPVYSTLTTYGDGDQVRGTGGNAHKLFESLQAANTNHPLTDATWWLPVGATNRWAMFDGSVQSQTTAADEIDVRLAVPGRADTLAALNVAASSGRVTMTDLVDGVVFDQTFSLVSMSGITDWWRYFFEPLERLDALIVDDMPPYADATVELQLFDAGETVACGELVVGFSAHIGDTQWGPQVGFTDFTVKTQDEFGNFTIVKRPFSDLASFNINVASSYVDQLKKLLKTYRATPILYIGDPDFSSTAVYGFFKSFNLVISGPDVSLCSLDIEGLV